MKAHEKLGYLFPLFLIKSARYSYLPRVPRIYNGIAPTDRPLDPIAD